jgi:mercuric ion binding protein
MLNKSKKVILELLVGFAALIIISCGKSDNKLSESQDKEKTQTTEVKSTSNDEKATVQLPTIQCNQCRKNITNALKKVDGVTDFNIDVKGKVMNVSFDKTKTDLVKIENAVTMAGYDANDKKADPVAYEKLDDCCKVPGKP